jgi:hypothetical protein
MTSLFDPGAYASAKIKILGDPDFLMQPAASSINSLYNQYYGTDGFTVNPNGGQVFIEINFREPQDYDISTGLISLVVPYQGFFTYMTDFGTNNQPNFIPPVPQNQSQNDYITNYQQTNDIINEYNSNIERSNSLDDMYNEIQVPILLAVLYFLFQLPFFRKFLFSYFPVLFSKDGNLNINGYIFMSALFGIFYYLLNKINTHFGKF